MSATSVILDSAALSSRWSDRAHLLMIALTCLLSERWHKTW